MTASRNQRAAQEYRQMHQALHLKRVLETALYVDDLGRSREFYEAVLLVKPLSANERVCAYDIGGQSILLLFKRGATLEPVVTSGGTIPPHDGRGPLHIGLAINEDELCAWERNLIAQGVTIEARMSWSRGGTSIYFRDPDGHLLELATPGLWQTY
jgi:catechol 2,3-dioxygenase-like lactoylglutathione lyase family enzyme